MYGSVPAVAALPAIPVSPAAQIPAGCNQDVFGKRRFSIKSCSSGS